MHYLEQVSLTISTSPQSGNSIDRADLNCQLLHVFKETSIDFLDSLEAPHRLADVRTHSAIRVASLSESGRPGLTLSSRSVLFSAAYFSAISAGGLVKDNVTCGVGPVDELVYDL